MNRNRPDEPTNPDPLVSLYLRLAAAGLGVTMSDLVTQGAVTRAGGPGPAPAAAAGENAGAR